MVTFEQLMEIKLDQQVMKEVPLPDKWHFPQYR